MVNIQSIQSLLVTALWALPLVTGLVQVVKSANFLADRYIPAASVLIGIIIGILLIQLSVVGAFVGLILGLGATGLWEFGKTTVAGISTKNEKC